MDWNIIKEALLTLRNYLTPFSTNNLNRKRRRSVVDLTESRISPKMMRIESSRDLDADDYYGFSSLRRPKRSPEIINLDDDDEEIVTLRRGNEFRFETKKKSNSYNGNVKLNGNCDDDDDIIIVGESKIDKKSLPHFVHPTTMINNPLNGAVPRKQLRKEKKLNVDQHSSNSLDYSFRLDEKMRYKNLLEKTFSGDESVYSTPVGMLFEPLNSSSRGAKMLQLSRTFANSPKSTLSTRDTIRKVLNDKVDTIEIKDSDSESDVIISPSPEPDIKVVPVNSLKPYVDSQKETRQHWLNDVVQKHRSALEERQRAMDQYKSISDSHNKINKNLRMERLAKNVERALQLRDVILPEKEPVQKLPELTDEHQAIIKRALSANDNEVVCKKFNLNITGRDIRTFAGLNWLNDEVINFYMNLIIERGKEDKWPNAYAFNTFFYTKLRQQGPESLKRWTKKIDLFSYEIICVPVHMNVHWCMAIIDLKHKTINYYDSMGCSNDICLDLLQKYLKFEHMDKKKSAFDTSDFVLENVKDIPNQMNGSDCGVFACTFAEFATRRSPFSFDQKDMPYLRKKMVLEIIQGKMMIK